MKLMSHKSLNPPKSMIAGWIVLFATFSLIISSVGQAAEPLDPAEIAKRIDAHLEKEREQAGIIPNAAVEDDVFLRRATLDLVGRIPTVAEVRAFTADERPKKRENLIAKLMESPTYDRHLSRALRRIWFPQTDVGRAQFLAEDTEKWIAAELNRETPYDEMVKQILSVDFSPESDRSVEERPADLLAVPLTFLLANEHKPELMAANSMRSFLGVNLDCAQCHDHPVARWSQDQFWETAAFFVSTKGSASGPGRIDIPDTERVATAQPIALPEIKWPEGSKKNQSQELFANWLTDKQNPYFAKNTVNRLWAHVFGAGLVEPLDDITAADQSPFEELLAELADDFVASDYDLPKLHAAMLLTKAYQKTTSLRESADDVALRMFARMQSRPLTGEQLYDSLRVATGQPSFNRDRATLQEVRQRQKFLEMFQLQEDRASDRSIVQSLALMNGEVTAAVSRSENSPLIVGIADAPFFTTHERIETIFLATVNRRPRPAEVETFVEYVAAHPGREGLADVLWALINSVEFNTNH